MNADSEIACVLAPLAEGSLLLPTVAVAEVLRRQPVRVDQGLPSWCVGRIMWRGVILPLISFEAACAADGSGPQMSAQDGVLVMNRTRHIEEFGFYGIVIRGTPRLLRLAEDDLDMVGPTEDDRSNPAAELARLLLGEEAAIIPRLSHLEDLILENRLYAPPKS